MRRRSVILLAMMCAGHAAGCDVERSEGTFIDPSGQGGEAGSDTGGTGGSVEEPPESLGDLPVDRLEDDGCVAMTATAVEVYGEDDAPLYPDRLFSVDGRRVAASSVEDGFVTFEANGSEAGEMNTFGIALNRVAVLGDQFAVVALDHHDDLELQRFDAYGDPRGPDRDVGKGPATALALTAGAAGMLVAWADEGEVALRALEGDGSPVGSPYTVTEEPMIDGVSLAAASTSDGHALAYGGAAYDGWRVRFVFVNEDGEPNEPVDIVTTSHPLRVIDLVATVDGFVLHLAAGTRASYLVRLDGAGYPVGSARELGGAHPGWDLAVIDDAVALVAPRDDGVPAMRVFDHALEPLGPWVCLAAAGDGTLNAAIDVEGEGFAVTFPESASTDVSPAVLFATLDATGAPLD